MQVLQPRDPKNMVLAMFSMVTFVLCNPLERRTCFISPVLCCAVLYFPGHKTVVSAPLNFAGSVNGQHLNTLGIKFGFVLKTGLMK